MKEGLSTEIYVSLNDQYPRQRNTRSLLTANFAQVPSLSKLGLSEKNKNHQLG